MKLKTVALIASIGAFIFTLFPAGSIIKSLNLKSRGTSTDAVVVNKSTGKKGLPAVTVSFSDPGGNKIEATASRRGFVSKGDMVKVRYNPASPKEIDFGDTVPYNMKGAIIGGLMFVLFFFYFVKFSIRDRANNLLIRKGLKIKAELVAVEKNTRYRMGKNDPWIIRCRWTDEKTGKDHFFASKDYTIDPAGYLEGRSFVDVYIDPSDPSRYFMDTSFMPKGNITIG
jgi:hypothetical protein